MALQKINQNKSSSFALYQPVQSMDTTQSTPSFFHSTPTSKGTFGHSIFTNTNQTQSIFAKPATEPVGFFGNSVSQPAYVESQVLNDNLDENYYTVISELTQKEIGQFKGNEFCFIPLNPPPKELCF